MAIDLDLKGKTVLVTGGASAIGEAIVCAFAKPGSKVGYVDIDQITGEALAAELISGGHAVQFRALDLRDIAALKYAIADLRDALGPICILVNNAADDARHTAESVTPEDFDDQIAVNLRHQFFASQAALPDMEAAGGGSIICMRSITWMVGFGGKPIYTTSKAAIIGLVRSLARDFGPANIRINAISPGWVITKRELELWLTPEADAERHSRQAIKRRIYPDTIATLTLVLASEDASAITGQNYVADGNWV